MHRALLAGERALQRARSAVSGFRPLRPEALDVEPRVLVSGFGPFLHTPRNATEEIVRALGVELRAGRVPGLATGRGRVRFPSGRTVLVSAMVLPVVWEAAAMLVAKEARALRPSVILMSGVASPVQPLLLERAASRARVAARDVWGVRHARSVPFSRPRPLPLRFDVAEDAGRLALAREIEETPSLGEVMLGVAAGAPRADNAYVCNATAHGVVTLLGRSARMLRSRAAPEGVMVSSPRLGRVDCGFLHWPRELRQEHIAGSARILLAMVDALLV